MLILQLVISRNTKISCNKNKKRKRVFKINKIIFSGNLGHDSELSMAQNTGKAILKWSVAVSKGYKKDDGTNWFNCVMFGERCEKLAQYLVKGTKVICEGSLQLGSYEDKQGVKKHTTDIVISNVEMIGNREEHQKPTQEQDDNYKDKDITPIDSSDIPF